MSYCTSEPSTCGLLRPEACYVQRGVAAVGGV